MPPAKKPDINGNWQCNYCQEFKPASEFNVDRKKKNGLRSYCRPCEVAWHRGYVERKKQQEIRYKAIEKGIADFLMKNPQVRDDFLRKHRSQLEPYISSQFQKLMISFQKKRLSNRKGRQTRYKKAA